MDSRVRTNPEGSAGQPAPPVVRVGLYLCLLYLMLGAVVPYLPVWLRDAKGLSASEIGVLFATVSFVRIAAGPLIAAWASGLSEGRTQYIVLSGAALVLLAAYGLAPGTASVMVAGVLFGIASQTQMPLAEARALAVTQSGTRVHFGHIRALASALFVAANLATGALIGQFGAWAAYGWIISVLAVVTAAAFLLPHDPQRRASAAPSQGFASRLGGSFGVLRTPGLLLVTGAAALVQASHAFYYGFSSNLWIDQGIAPQLIGLLWSVGVIAEIVFLVLVAPRLDKVNPVLMILIGAVACAMRWAALSVQPDLAVLVGLQTLHFATFGMTLIGTMRFIQQSVAPEDVANAQQLVSSLIMAPLFGTVALASGLLAQRFGAYGYLAVAATGLVAAALAGLGLRHGRVQRPRLLDPHTDNHTKTDL
jgi:MFS transporter, PPP family, 3-phenylpropionic acid transporter